MDYSQEKIYNLHPSDSVEDTLTFVKRMGERQPRAWSFFSAMLERVGMRWEYFVPR